VGWLLLAFFQKLPGRDFFFGRVSSLSWLKRKKPDWTTKKRGCLKLFRQPLFGRRYFL